MVTLTLCGCYYIVNLERKFLPQVEVSAHTTVLSTTSRTELTQTFVNPTDSKIKELRYQFPLYDGVSVVGFKVTVGDRVLESEVRERGDAQQKYQEAVDKGDTAGLFYQSYDAADVFTTKLGNVDAKETVKVEITYIGELKHDVGSDAVRFTIPTVIAPRYGRESDPVDTNVTTKGISFTLDAEVPEGFAIEKIYSPSHPTEYTPNKLSTALDAAPAVRKGSITLAQRAVELGDDIVILIKATDTGEPTALLERHPTADTQALMVTLVPKFKIEAEALPEIVFLCDRSGSMWDSITDLKEALRIFLKSLRPGVKFNICSFGSNFDFLWPKSRTYDQQSLAEASRLVESMSANYGGTEMYGPMQATFKQRYKDMKLEVFLLTDGEIWNQDKLFGLINDHVKSSKGAIRVFSLGVGAGASSSLIEGIARAGNGFAQVTAPGEKMNAKVVRMLRESMSPHITNYSLKVKYKSDDGFELVNISDYEVVSSKLEKPTTPPSEKTPDSPSATASRSKSPSPVKKIISLFQRDYKDDVSSDSSLDKFKGDKFKNVPPVHVPGYLQTPSQIPTLFAFNRTTAYVIINNTTSVPESVIISATHPDNKNDIELELPIPVTQLETRATTLHQLAARREMKELEEGRGWLSFATDEKNKLLKEKYSGRFSDMVERESVRLGTTYQVVGKWTSFVALQKKSSGQDTEKGETATKKAKVSDDDGLDFEDFLPVYAASETAYDYPRAAMRPVHAARGPLLKKSKGAPMFSFGGGGGASRARNSSASVPRPQQVSAPRSLPPPPPGAMAFGIPAPSPVDSVCMRGYAAPPPAPMPSVSACSAPPAARRVRQKEEATFGGPIDYASPEMFCAALPDESSDEEDLKAKPLRPGHGVLSSAAQESALPQVTGDPLQTLTMLQSFVGNWSWNASLQAVLSIGPDAAAKLTLPPKAAENGGNNDVFATACAVAFFKKRLSESVDIWVMMVEKAEDWLVSEVGDATALLQAVATLF